MFYSIKYILGYRYQMSQRNFRRVVDFNQLRSRKELKRIDWRTVKRVMSALYENARMKKSFLATACNMGYDKCRLYLDWLEMMELVRREDNEDGFEVIILTERGRSLYNKKFNI
jgi:predicted transcriptional regulator